MVLIFVKNKTTSMNIMNMFKEHYLKKHSLNNHLKYAKCFYGSVSHAEPILCTICYNTPAELLGHGQSLVVKKYLRQLLELWYDTTSCLSAQV